MQKTAQLEMQVSFVPKAWLGAVAKGAIYAHTHITLTPVRPSTIPVSIGMQYQSVSGVQCAS